MSHLLTRIPANSHRALHQNKVRDHQTALRQRPRQREQGLPRPSRRAGSSQGARGRARAQDRGHRVCQAKARGPAGRGERERRVVALDQRAVSPRDRAVGRFRVGVTAPTTTGARRRRRAGEPAAAARRLAVASGPRGLGRPLGARAVCRLRLRLRLRRRWFLMAGPVRGPVRGLLAVAGWCLSLALGLRLCCLCEGAHVAVSG